MTPGSSSLSEPSPKPPKRSILGWPNSPAHWASPGTAFPAPLRGLCPRGGVVSSGWKVKAKALSQLLPEAPPSRKSRGGAWPPGRLSGHSRGSVLSGLPRSPWAKRGDRAEFKSRSWRRPPRSGLGRGGREGGRARIQRRIQSWPDWAVADALGFGTDQAGWPGLRLAGARETPVWAQPAATRVRPGSAGGHRCLEPTGRGRGAGGTAGRRSPFARPPARACVRPACVRAGSGRAGVGAAGAGTGSPPGIRILSPSRRPRAPAPGPGPRRCSRRRRSRQP